MSAMKDIVYVGVNDHVLDLFEGQYPVPNGMAYNSYILVDEKIAVMDSVEAGFADLWLENIRTALGDRTPDYLVVQHMEPDHSGSIMRFLEAYPNAQVIASQRAFVMAGNFFGTTLPGRAVSDGDSLSLGRHRLRFYTAPMVHWPEVIVTYDETAKVLFSADAFGKFGALDVDGDWADEARRYYFGIVGKYGGPVQTLFKKLAPLEISAICPLHGPVLQENLSYYLGLYHTWSTYTPEAEGITIAYASIYGNTKKAALQLARQLEEQGCRVALHDLARGDMFAAVADAFRYDRLVLAASTYNGGVFPFMQTFIHHLTERGYTGRTVAFIENGSWAPAAMRVMRSLLEKSKNLTYAENNVTILSTLSQKSEAQLSALAEELCRRAGTAGAEETAAEAPKKKFVCKICGYIHEADSLSADFTCPLCRRPASDFEEAE